MQMVELSMRCQEQARDRRRRNLEKTIQKIWNLNLKFENSKKIRISSSSSLILKKDAKKKFIDLPRWQRFAKEHNVWLHQSIAIVTVRHVTSKHCLSNVFNLHLSTIEDKIEPNENNIPKQKKKKDFRMRSERLK